MVLGVSAVLGVGAGDVLLLEAVEATRRGEFVPSSALISSALMVLNVLPFESSLAVSTVPDVLLFGFMSGVLVTLDVPSLALISSALGVLSKVLLFESVLAISTVPDVLVSGVMLGVLATLDAPFVTLDVPDDAHDPMPVGAGDMLLLSSVEGVEMRLFEATDVSSEGAVVFGIIDGDELLASATAEVLEGTGFDIAINPVVPDDVDASTLKLSAVADGDALPFKGC